MHAKEEEIYKLIRYIQIVYKYMCIRFRSYMYNFTEFLRKLLTEIMLLRHLLFHEVEVHKSRLLMEASRNENFRNLNTNPKNECHITDFS